MRCRTAVRTGIVGRSAGGDVTVESPVICRVDNCERRAAASVVTEHLPGPIQLCATHTEDFRMNGAAWTVTWRPGETLPVSVRAAPAGPVGRAWSGAASGAPVSRNRVWARWRTRLSGRDTPGGR